MSGRLGELLVRENLISVQQLRKAQEEQQKTGTRIGTALIKVGAIEESKLTDFLSKQYGVPAINLKEFDVEPDIIKLVPKDVASKHLVVPVNRAGSALIVAMCDPSNIYAVDDLKFLTGYNIEAVVASEPAIREAIERFYAEKGPSLESIVEDMGVDDVELTETSEDNVEEAAKAADDAPVIKLVNLILLDAIRKKASDIHIEPYEKALRVRYRIDGLLYEVMKPPLKLKNAISSRIKIMSNLSIPPPAQSGERWKAFGFEPLRSQQQLATDSARAAADPMYY
jgi:type IV pilus assembly protein PilB